MTRLLKTAQGKRKLCLQSSGFSTTPPLKTYSSINLISQVEYRRQTGAIEKWQLTVIKTFITIKNSISNVLDSIPQDQYQKFTPTTLTPCPPKLNYTSSAFHIDDTNQALQSPSAPSPNHMEPPPQHSEPPTPTPPVPVETTLYTLRMDQPDPPPPQPKPRTPPLHTTTTNAAFGTGIQEDLPYVNKMSQATYLPIQSRSPTH